MDNRRFALCHARFFVAQMPETALRIYQTTLLPYAHLIYAQRKGDLKMAEAENKRQRRTPQERANELDEKITKINQSINELEEKKKRQLLPSKIWV